ncbi:LRR 5 domain containing protein [Asbolus verrucosus]|uniref:LRR 5 domain containing protein n=1 Tax=Asbolus verrucosus TaxID=1661398 RepID=A0A482VQJ7_ASBVE|nr:LRR 5 domain containing protein [Asbolus verrucosus]
MLLKLGAIQIHNGFQFSLNKLDLSGTENAPVAVQDVRRFRNLRVLSLSRLSQQILSVEDFLEFGTDLEELKITFGHLQIIKNNAFKHVHGLKKLQLSDNKINNIENNAFVDISHSLVSLKLFHAFSSSVQNFPTEAIKTLSNLEELDISNNEIKNMPDTSFHFLKKLKRLSIQDNIIEIVYKGTFQVIINFMLI